MAYVSKELKAKVADLMKAEFGKDPKARGFKYSLSINHYSTLVCTISEGSIDFVSNTNEKNKEKYGDNYTPAGNHIQVNEYHLDSNFTGKALEVLQKIKKFLDTDNFDHSDVMTDYFHVAHYIDIQYVMDTNEFRVNSNAKDPAYIVEKFLETQMSAGEDHSPVNVKEEYNISLRLDLSEDRFLCSHDCGNK